MKADKSMVVMNTFARGNEKVSIFGDAAECQMNDGSCVAVTREGSLSHAVAGVHGQGTGTRAGKKRDGRSRGMQQQQRQATTGGQQLMRRQSIDCSCSLFRNFSHKFHVSRSKRRESTSCAFVASKNGTICSNNFHVIMEGFDE